MRPYLKYIFLFFACISISACSDTEDVKAAKNQTTIFQGLAAQFKVLNDQCRAQLTDVESRLETVKGDYIQKALVAESMSREAAIANACKKPFDINICPESMTKAGENAILQGVSGGDSPIFWTVYAMKLLLIMFVVVLPFALLADYLSRRIKPNLGAYSRVEKAILDAQEKIISYGDEIKIKQKELALLSASISEKEDLLESVIDKHEDATTEYQDTLININNDKYYAAEKVKYLAERALALSSFKTKPAVANPPSTQPRAPAPAPAPGREKPVVDPFTKKASA